MVVNEQIMRKNYLKNWRENNFLVETIFIGGNNIFEWKIYF